jgi:TPR repeat protein
MLHYGLALLSGTGVARNPASAAQWLVRAAPHDSTGEASYQLGLLLHSGQGVPADPAKARAVWTDNVRRTGHVLSQQALASSMGAGM